MVKDIEIKFKNYKKTRKVSKFIYINRPKQIEKNTKIAVIVPYRDNPIQNRKAHLRQFLNYFKSYLSKFNYKIFIIEQSDDGNKFNRGKLLNIGLKMAIDQGYDNLITHDVDLLPNDELLPFYTNIFDIPIHIAHRWSKYKYESYFGGIVSFTKDMIMKFNGYPNDFWGWGGEDDSLYNRITENMGKIGKPNVGKIKDLHHEETKKDKRNKKKWENILDDLENWKSNGINNLNFNLLKKNEDNNVGIYTVKI